MGFEKMCNIKCRTSNLKVDCAVIVCTIRALKMHGGIIRLLREALWMEKLAQKFPAVEKGCKNLENISKCIVTTVLSVVVINSFPTDTRMKKLELIKKGL